MRPVLFTEDDVKNLTSICHLALTNPQGGMNIINAVGLVMNKVQQSQVPDLPPRPKIVNTENENG